MALRLVCDNYEPVTDTCTLWSQDTNVDSLIFDLTDPHVIEFIVSIVTLFAIAFAFNFLTRFILNK
jgi:hypothetical protein